MTWIAALLLLVTLIALGCVVCALLAARGALSIERGSKTPEAPKMKRRAYWNI